MNCYKGKTNGVNPHIRGGNCGGRLIGDEPTCRTNASQIKLDNTGWRKLSWLWVAMFVCSAIANEIAWRNLSTDAWVTFKVFGLTGISLVFVILTLPVIQKHQQQDQ